MEWDFEKNGTVEKLDDVPEKYRGLYSEVTEGEDAGKFKVSDAAKGLVADYVGTTKSLQQARGDKKTASDEAAQRRTALKHFEDMTSELGIEVEEGDELHSAFKKYVDGLIAQNKEGSETKVNLDKIKGEYERRLNEAIAAKDKELKTMEGNLFDTKVTQVATRELSEAKGSTDLLLPIIKEKCRVVKDGENYVVRVIDDQGDFRSDGAGGWMSVKDLVGEMKGSENYARAFESEAKDGGGKKPNSSSTENRPSTPATGGDKTAIQKISSGLAGLRQGTGVGAGA